MAKRIDLDNWVPIDTTNPLKSLAHEVEAQLDIIEADIEDLRKEVATKVTKTTATTTATTAGPVMVGGAPNPFAPIVVTSPQGYKAANLDDGIELTLDTLAVQLAPSGARSLQMRVTSGTMSVNISGQAYWSNGNYGGNYTALYWNGNTLNTTYQQIFTWSFPWANDKAVYSVMDLTNRRYYRVTLIIGPGYKKNFIIMERLV